MNKYRGSKKKRSIRI